jgi:hypothetical protein
MKNSILFLALTLALPLAADDHADCPMHAQHVAAQGDHVMGFSHEATTHHFRLLRDGGAIEARANDAKDAESIAAIRAHMKGIARDFADGSFEKPLAIHGRLPDGAEAMNALRDSISYRYEELENGARVRVSTKDAAALDAVHAFLRFQIDEHHTGDKLAVE